MAHRASMKSVPELILVLIVACLFGSVQLVKLLIHILRKGPKCLFSYRTRKVVRPAILSLSSTEFGTHTFVKLPKAGIKLHCVINGPPDKPLMLLLHGFPEFWFSWRQQLKDFSREYRVVACDMRGYGDSDKPAEVDNYILDKFAGDIDELITAFGYDKCVLVGHSWGGIISMCYATLHPERIDRLIILNAPHPRAYEEQVRVSLTQIRYSWYVFAYQWPVFPELMMLADDMNMQDEMMCGKELGARPGTLPPDIMAVYKYPFASFSDWTGGINIYRAFLQYRTPEFESAFAHGDKIKVPTMLIWGTASAYVMSEVAVRNTKFFERCDVNYLDGSTHWVLQEEPEQVTRLMRQYLQQELQ